MQAFQALLKALITARLQTAAPDSVPHDSVPSICVLSLAERTAPPAGTAWMRHSCSIGGTKAGSLHRPTVLRRLQSFEAALLRIEAPQETIASRRLACPSSTATMCLTLQNTPMGWICSKWGGNVTPGQDGPPIRVAQIQVAKALTRDNIHHKLKPLPPPHAQVAACI